MLSRQI